MSNISQFISSLQDPSQAVDPNANFSPDDFYAQTLQSSGYTLGSDPCLDKCWDDFQRCLRQSTDGGSQCMAQLTACHRTCGSATADSVPAPSSLNHLLPPPRPPPTPARTPPV